MQTMREVTKKLQLEVNEDKTRICHIPEESFDFLGYTFGQVLLPQNGRAIWAQRHRRRASANLRCDHAETGRHTMTQSAEKNW